MATTHQTRNESIRALTNRLTKPTVRRSRAALPAATLALLSLAAHNPAHADIMWTLSGVTFQGGGTETGTFTTDDSGNLTKFDITTTSGSGFPGFTYDSTAGVTILLTTATEFEIRDPTNTFDLDDVFISPLLSVNSPDSLTQDTAETEFNPSGTSGANRTITSGTATSSPLAPVPVPTPGPAASLALLALSLFLLRPKANRRGGHQA
jgi:hypothetical protein